MDKETWLDNVKKRSVTIQSYMKERTYDDSIGWKQQIEVLLNQPYKDRPSGLLITGPQGCGKHTVAALSVQALTERDYSILFLSGRILREGIENSRQLIERINAALDDAYDLKNSLCIVIDEIDDSEMMYDSLAFLGQCSCDYWLHAEDLPELFYILIEDQYVKLPALLKERMYVCRMDVPDELQRKQFIEHAAKDLLHYIPMEKVTEVTGNFSYGKIREFISELGLRVDAREQAIPVDEIVKLAHKYQTPPTRMDLLEKLIKEIHNVGGSVVHALENIHPVSVEVKSPEEEKVPQFVQVLENKGDFFASETERIKGLPVKQLAYELFGEEATEQLLVN